MKTDTALKREVLDGLEWEPGIKATGIGVGIGVGVDVRDGVVTS
jgi:hypothetical protein